jgi:NAD(P)-dependent dehydrogenase (short-subunit alcohol dehydrogenase family)
MHEVVLLLFREPHPRCLGADVADDGLASFGDVDMLDGHLLLAADIAEVGRVVAFLVGCASSGITGDTIYVDGGLHNMA